MSAPFDVFSFFFDSEVNRWIDPETNRPLSQLRINTQIEKVLDATSDIMDAATRQWYDGTMGLEMWETIMGEELSESYKMLAMMAAGGRDNMTPASWGRVGQAVRVQYDFLRKFTGDLAEGVLTEAQAAARARVYGQSANSAYWREWKAVTELEPLSDRLPFLPNDPGDGQNPPTCLGNCNCHLRATDEGVRWILDPASSHCPGCVQLSRGGPYRV